MAGKGRNKKNAKQHELLASFRDERFEYCLFDMCCVEVMTCHAIIPKNRSASAIARSLSSGHCGCFASSDFALL